MNPFGGLAVIFCILVGLLCFQGSNSNWSDKLRSYHDECDKAGGLVLRTISRDNVQQMNCYTGVAIIKIKGDN